MYATRCARGIDVSYIFRRMPKTLRHSNLARKQLLQIVSTFAHYHTKTLRNFLHQNRSQLIV